MSEETGNDIPAIRDVGYCKPPVETRFKPGQSGNPSGRPKKVRELTAIAEEHSEQAMRNLAKLMSSQDEKVSLAASREILDRSMGKPTQTNVNVTKSDVADLDINELYAIAKSGSSGDHQAVEGEGEPDPVH